LQKNSIKCKNSKVYNFFDTNFYANNACLVLFLFNKISITKQKMKPKTWNICQKKFECLSTQLAQEKNILCIKLLEDKKLFMQRITQNLWKHINHIYEKALKP
jgi:hypothetical protein